MNLGVVVGVKCLVVYSELRFHFVMELGGGVNPVGNSFEFKVRRETDKTAISGMCLENTVSISEDILNGLRDMPVLIGVIEFLLSISENRLAPWRQVSAATKTAVFAGLIKQIPGTPAKESHNYWLPAVPPFVDVWALDAVSAVNLIVVNIESEPVDLIPYYFAYAFGCFPSFNVNSIKD